MGKVLIGSTETIGQKFNKRRRYSAPAPKLLFCFQEASSVTDEL